MKTDFSFNRDGNDTSSHIFANLSGKLNENTNFDLKLQNVNNDNYLKIHDIKSYTPIIESDSVLSSHFKIDKDIDDNTNLIAKVRLYEDLSKTDSDKYQYIFPDFNFKKEIELDENYNGKFNFSSTGFQKVYNTNIYETLINNDFNFESYDFISSKGIVTDYSFLLKNFNTYSENSTIYEERNDHEITNNTQQDINHDSERNAPKQCYFGLESAARKWEQSYRHVPSVCPRKDMPSFRIVSGLCIYAAITETVDEGWMLG